MAHLRKPQALDIFEDFGILHFHFSLSFLHSFISFHFISFHFISFHFISFHFISFHFISFHFISFHFISFHFISFHFISFHFISFHFISFHFISFQFVLSGFSRFSLFTEVQPEQAVRIVHSAPCAAISNDGLPRGFASKDNLEKATLSESNALCCCWVVGCSGEKITVRGAALGEFDFRKFSSAKCVFCFTSNRNCHFSSVKR